MDKVQKIRAEIERRYNERDRVGDNIRANVHKSLISFIDSLQKEPVSIDFEQELYKAFGQVKDFTLGMRIAKRFYDMGKKSREPVSEDLGEYINELSKQFPEVSFAKLSRIAVRVAKWQKENLWKPADGDDLPEIDRDVIALTQPHPNDEHLRVVFAHRPNKYAKVWNSDLGEEQVVEIERHGKGEWNVPNVKYWLDVELQNMED